MTSATPGLVDEPATGALDPGTRRAIGLLLVYAVIDAVGVALVVGAGEVVAGAYRVLFAFGITVAIAVALVIAFGLSRGRRWARPAAIGVLGILAISGGIDLVTGLRAGGLTIPVRGIAALAVLASWRPPAVGVEGRARPMSVGDRMIVVVLVGASGVVTLVGPPVLTWLLTAGNSPFAVTSAAIEVHSSLDCQAFAAADVTSRAPVSGSLGWRWSEHEPLPRGTDSLAIRWSVTPQRSDGAGRYVLYLADAPGYHSDGLSSSLDGSAGGPYATGVSSQDTTLADGLATASGVDPGASFVVAIDVAEQGLRDDRVDFVLQPYEMPVHGTLTVEGFYVHRNAWSAGPAVATCSW